MSGNRFLISDTHFGHTNTWQKFTLSDGSPLRPFTSTEEMDETMVENWNRVVRPQDTVYHLGDVVIARRNLETVKRLNGRKILIRGNHDIFRDKDYYEAGFEQIHGVRVFVDKFILSHIPLHPDCVSGRFRVNVHGHLHSGQIMRQCRIPELRHMQEPDPRYFCVCVERTNFTPMHFDEVEAAIQKRFVEYNYEPPKGHFNGSTPG